MFRDCYFIYAGKSSQQYNLKLMFIEDEYKTFDSGGKYSLDTAPIGKSSELSLYDKNYEDCNFKIDIEIVNCNTNISEIEMIEIKQWLFAQPLTWQKLQLVTEDIMGDVFFYCYLIPNVDYTDGNGYRALRCQMYCNSSYAYKEARKFSIEKPTYQYTNQTAPMTIKVDIADLNTLPVIIIESDTSQSVYTNLNGGVVIENTTNATTAYIKNAALCFGDNQTAKITIDCQTGVISCNNSTSPNAAIGTTSYPFGTAQHSSTCGLLKLNRGINELQVAGDFTRVTVTYVPTVRVGAF